MTRNIVHTFVLFLLACLAFSAGCSPSAPLLGAAPAAAQEVSTPQSTETTPATAAATAAPGSTETATLTPPLANTPTALAQGTLKQDAVLYSGPGNAGYDTLATLKAGTGLGLIGTFVDFVQVQAVVDGNQTRGFVVKGALASLPSGLGELGPSQVPWAPSFILNNFVGDYTRFQGAQIKLENTTNGYWDVEGKAIPLNGPFKVTGALQVEGAPNGSVKLLGIPEPRSGDWWRGITRLDIQIYQNNYQLIFLDGTSENGQKIDLPIAQDQQWSIVFQDPQGKTLSVRNQNGEEIKTVDVTATPGLKLPDGLFPKKELYLGASTVPHSTLTLSSLSLQFSPSGKSVSAPAEPSSLRTLAAAKGITLGTKFEMGQMQDSRYWNIMAKDFDMAVLSGFSCNSGFWLGRGDYDFSSLDRIVDSAVSQGWRVRAYDLAWGATEPPCGPPAWMAAGNFTRDDYVKILQEHVQAVVTHFKGRVTEWSIANEAISRSFCGSGCDYWNDKIGPDYIEIAFRAAREADPNAVLIFNDDNNESHRDSKTQRIVAKMYDTVQALKVKGVPIDEVGMEMHLFLPGDSSIPPQQDDVITTMRSFASLGVSIYVTGFDVNVTNVAGSQKGKWNYQAGIYHDMLAACLKSGVCHSFATWGVADSTSWITCMEVGCVKQPDGDPLMFDKDFNPKTAYYAVRDALIGK